MYLTVVLPAYNESDNIVQVIDELCKTFEKNQALSKYEIWVIDDHSEDDTFQKVQSFQKPNINALRLSRRSGSHTAIRAGLAQAQGDILLCISADGQDNAAEILDAMIDKIKQGVHIVWGIREKRKEPLFIKIWAMLFYRILFLFAPEGNRHINYANADFYLIHKKVIQAINACKERNTSLFGLIIWSGFHQDFVIYNRRDRFNGASKWNFKSRMKLALDWIMAFSGLPLRLITYTGLFFASVGFIYALIILFLAFLGKTAPGFAEPVILTLFMGGIQMVMLGVLGEYLWRNLEEGRKRPLYFIEEDTTENNQS